MIYVLVLEKQLVLVVIYLPSVSSVQFGKVQFGQESSPVQGNVREMCILEMFMNIFAVWYGVYMVSEVLSRSRHTSRPKEFFDAWRISSCSCCRSWSRFGKDRCWALLDAQ